MTRLFDGKPGAMSIRDVSDATGISEDYLRRLAGQGRFPAYRICKRQWIIPKDDFIAWLEDKGVEPGDQENN